MLLRKVFLETSAVDLEDLPVVSVLNDENRLRIALETIAEHINHSGAVSRCLFIDSPTSVVYPAL